MSDELNQPPLDAQVQLWNHMFGFINSMSLNCAVELGIADIIHSHGPTPVTLPDLAASIPISPNKTSYLRRLMRLLVHSGIFAVGKRADGDEGFLLTPVSSLLVVNNSNSSNDNIIKRNMAPYVSMMLDSSLVSPWHFMGEWLKGKDTPATPFGMCHGADLWEWANQHPDFNGKFNKAMACDAQNSMKYVLDKCATAFEGLRSVVDVGGGTGGSARVIAEAFPDMAMTVLDLPHVVAGLHDDSKVKFVGGDLFQSIPPADAIFLKCILHGFNDEECIKTLKNCREAIQNTEQGGKVMIVDMVVNFIQGEYEMTHSQYCCDLKMMVCTTGKEREEKEWKKLFEDAGFSTYKITPVFGMWSLIELYP